MPKFPDFSSRPDMITGSVFEKYKSRLAQHGQNLLKLHIGDTYLPASYPLPLSGSFLSGHLDYNRYCNTFGLEPLRLALAAKLQSDNALPVTAEEILVTAGATNALSMSMMALVDPGDEVLVLSPAWPFFFGMVKLAGGRVADVPLYMRLYENPNLDITGYVSRFVSERTCALYLNTPNNPSGKVLSRTQLEQVAEVVRKNGLWLISDEAYDGLTFDGLSHISIASLPGMAERSISVFTFSKSLMFAGLRLGYLVASRQVVQNLNKIMVHQLYSPATVAQQMMVEPVKTCKQWLPGVLEHYQELRDLMIDRLAIDVHRPEAGYFVFFDAEEQLHGRNYWQVIERCLDLGVAVAPGGSFGASYEHHIRLCFTGEPRPRLEAGIAKINDVLLGS